MMKGSGSDSHVRLKGVCLVWMLSWAVVCWKGSDGFLLRPHQQVQKGSSWLMATTTTTTAREEEASPESKGNKPKLILITGSPGTGKSTFGMTVALDQGILKCISTDTVRSVMRSFVSKDVSPALHRSSYAPAFEGDEPVRSWKETCMVLQHGVEDLVDDAIARGVSLVVEGVHILPSNYLIDKWNAAGGIAMGIVLEIKDADTHKKQLTHRGIQTSKMENETKKLKAFHRIRAIQDEMLRLGKQANWLRVGQRTDPTYCDIVADVLQGIEPTLPTDITPPSAPEVTQDDDSSDPQSDNTDSDTDNIVDEEVEEKEIESDEESDEQSDDEEVKAEEPQYIQAMETKSSGLPESVVKEEEDEEMTPPSKPAPPAATTQVQAQSGNNNWLGTEMHLSGLKKARPGKPAPAPVTPPPITKQGPQRQVQATSGNNWLGTEMHLAGLKKARPIQPVVSATTTTTTTPSVDPTPPATAATDKAPPAPPQESSSIEPPAAPPTTTVPPVKQVKATSGNNWLGMADVHTAGLKKAGNKQPITTPPPTSPPVQATSGNTWNNMGAMGPNAIPKPRDELLDRSEYTIASNEGRPDKNLLNVADKHVSGQVRAKPFSRPPPPPSVVDTPPVKVKVVQTPPPPKATVVDTPPPPPSKTIETPKAKEQDTSKAKEETEEEEIPKPKGSAKSKPKGFGVVPTKKPNNGVSPPKMSQVKSSGVSKPTITNVVSSKKSSSGVSKPTISNVASSKSNNSGVSKPTISNVSSSSTPKSKPPPPPEKKEEKKVEPESSPPPPPPKMDKNKEEEQQPELEPEPEVPPRAEYKPVSDIRAKMKPEKNLLNQAEKHFAGQVKASPKLSEGNYYIQSEESIQREKLAKIKEEMAKLEDEGEDFE